MSNLPLKCVRRGKSNGYCNRCLNLEKNEIQAKIVTYTREYENGRDENQLSLHFSFANDDEPLTLNLLMAMRTLYSLLNSMKE